MSFVADTFNALTGQTAAEASLQGAGIQGAAIDRAIAEERASLEQFQPLISQGIGQAGFLTDPNQQFQFLQNNPLFKLALENANTQTNQMAAARGRLSAGDTLQQLSNNVLLSASPLIDRQTSNIQNLINTGANLTTGATSNITDLITTGGAVGAAGVTGAANARTAGTQNLLTTGLLAGSLFFPPTAAAAPAAAPADASDSDASDQRLKENIKKIGVEKGFNIYSWTWNKLAESLGLRGVGFGVIAQEVMKIRPDAVINDNGYYKVYYQMLGIKHGEVI